MKILTTKGEKREGIVPQEGKRALETTRLQQEMRLVPWAKGRGARWEEEERREEGEDTEKQYGTLRLVWTGPGSWKAHQSGTLLLTFGGLLK